jgi:integrase
MAIYTRMRANPTGREKWTGVWNKKRTQEWDGKWAWEVGSGANRKRGIADTYEDAVSKEAQARRELLTGKVLPASPKLATVKAAVDRYLAIHLEKWHPATQRAKKRVLLPFTERYGALALLDLRPSHCLEFLEDHSRKESRIKHLPYGERAPGGGEYLLETKKVPENKNKFNRFRTALVSFFKYCRPAFNLPGTWNPMEGISPYKKSELKKPKREILTDEDLEKLLEKALEEGERVGVGRQYHSLLTALSYTGGRKEEILSWTWTDHIDFDGSKDFPIDEKDPFEGPKVRLDSRKGGERQDWLPMAPQLLRSLEWQYKNRLPQSDYVFQVRGSSWKGQKRYGKRIRYASQLIERLIEKAGIYNGGSKPKNIDYHSFRHYFCSKVGEKVGRDGIDIDAARKLTRHWTAEIFVGTYVHTQKSKKDTMETVFGND